MESKTSSIEIANGLFKLQYPYFSAFNYRFGVPLVGSVNVQKALIGSFFYLGLGSFSFLMYKALSFSTSRIRTFLASFFNARKYLTSKIESASQLQNARYYAVIYGATNRAGIAFAKYLAGKGFNLILIDRESKTL